MIRACASGMMSYSWKDAAKLMIEAHSLPYEAAQVAFTLNPEPMKFVLEGKRGPRGGRGKFYYNEDSAWPLRWIQMHEKGDVHAVWPILKRMKGARSGVVITPGSVAAWRKTVRLALMYGAGPSALLKISTPNRAFDFVSADEFKTQVESRLYRPGDDSHQADVYRYLLTMREKSDDPS